MSGGRGESEEGRGRESVCMDACGAHEVISGSQARGGSGIRRRGRIFATRAPESDLHLKFTDEGVILMCQRDKTDIASCL